MTLRKCPSCKDTVGADSSECPRCGVNFRSAQIRRAVIWTATAALLLWLVYHFILRSAVTPSKSSSDVSAVACRR